MMTRVGLVKGGLVGMFVVGSMGCLGLESVPEEAAGTDSGSTSASPSVEEDSEGTAAAGTLGDTLPPSTTTAGSTLGGTDSATSGTRSETESSSGGATSSAGSTSSTDTTDSGSAEETGQGTGGSSSGQLAFSRDGSVVMLDPGTGDEVVLTADHVAYDFVWDPDGSGIYFHEFTPGGGHVLHRADLNGQTSTILASDRYPFGLAVSSDGERLGWLALDPELAEDAFFVLVNADGSGPSEVTLTPPHSIPLAHAFGPELEQLAWSHGHLIRHASLPEAEGVSLGSGFCASSCATSSPAYSPSGSQLAFTVSQGSTFTTSDLYIVGTDGTGLANITADFDVPAGDGRWSPNGDRIAFVAYPSDSSPEIYVVGIDGTGLQNLSNSEPSEREPAWSPNGLRLAWLRGNSVEIDVMAYDFETEQSVLVATGAYFGVTQGGFSRSTPAVAWSPSAE